MPNITVKSLYKTWTFDSLEDAVVSVDRSFPIANLKYGWLKEWSRSFNFTFGAGDDVVFYDEIGLLPVWRVKEAFYNLPVDVRDPPYRGYWRWWKYHRKPEHFRKEPVPHTGKRSYGHDRRIRTLHELKAEKAFESDEYRLEYRIKHRTRYIPGDRDDHITYVPKCHNWKKHRAHQWKG
jgi:hypothetical protein